ncbi:hypothetical protein M9H77_27859 [Catharanthus roseus]|uniref:Uncharacterized protein n=1 Tax=Catharanthus roseus TaxID=4058 RepID=A0ACC0AEB2_CATRO|nr:hypothetical protein M9H77_27859 [Catharanthus roseus]
MEESVGNMTSGAFAAIRTTPTPAAPSRMVCNRCLKPNHEMSSCYRFVGYLYWWGEREAKSTAAVLAGVVAAGEVILATVTGEGNHMLGKRSLLRDGRRRMHSSVSATQISGIPELSTRNSEPHSSI